MSDTLKRLEEIEARVASQGDPAWVEAELVDARWLCARLRDALAVIESRKETIEQTFWAFKLRGAEPEWVAAYRRLFGEEERRG